MSGPNTTFLLFSRTCDLYGIFVFCEVKVWLSGLSMWTVFTRVEIPLWGLAHVHKPTLKASDLRIQGAG